jgi:hypothetical protein
LRERGKGPRRMVRSKFRMPSFPPLSGQQEELRGPSRPVTPRARDLTLLPLRSSRQPMRAVKKSISKPKSKVVLKGAREAKLVRPTVVDLLCKRKDAESRSSCFVDNAGVADSIPICIAQAGLREPKSFVEDAEAYVKAITKEILAGRLDIRGNPWVLPRDPFQEAASINANRARAGERPIASSEALNLILRPAIFAWAPEKLSPGLQVCCPDCGKPGSFKQWWKPRTLHQLNGHCIYFTTRHLCQACEAIRRPSSRIPRGGHRRGKMFLADEKRTMDLMPTSILCSRNFVDTGRTICDASVVDLARALATRTSWSAIAETINELKSSTWVQNVTLRYLRLCEALQIEPLDTQSSLPDMYSIRDEWVRNLFMSDSQERHQEVAEELAAEKGNDILILDWTRGAAARCGSNFLFNAMSGDRRILISEFTETSGPREVQALIWKLHRRGVRPKVVYVDDECCGVWKSLLEEVWPGVHVRLDCMHAIRRLTQTTTSTQHPWHGRFCAKLSDAFYTYHPRELARLRQAWERDDVRSGLPMKTQAKYIPRVISNIPHIIAAVDKVISSFCNRADEDSGPLLTPGTHNAWANLQTHLQAGCLCDPPDIQMHAFDGKSPLIIGGEEFRQVRSLRGSSALEGFHTHQKHWLGPLAHHANDAGKALLDDGQLRWNRKRRNEGASGAFVTPMVFRCGLLQRTDDLHQCQKGSRLYPNLIHVGRNEARECEEQVVTEISSSDIEVPACE